MTHVTEQSVLLFSYGTLQDQAVQLATFGRELKGRADSLPGYKQNWVEITDIVQESRDLSDDDHCH
jgi:hypothetical protein